MAARHPIRVDPPIVSIGVPVVSVRWFALVAVAGVVVGVLAWSLTGLSGTDSAAPSASPSTPSLTPGGSPGVSPGAGSGSAARSAGAGGSRGSTPSAAGASSAAGGAAPTQGGRPVGSEVLPSPSSSAHAQTGLPGLKQPRSSTAPLVASPLPRPAVEKGSLVAGYPAVLAPPAQHTIAVSSVAPAQTVMQASLTASCRRPCNVLRRYRLRLAARGFTEVAAPSVENRPAASFRRGDDSVTVTVTAQSAKTIAYAVFAILHTAKA